MTGQPRTLPLYLTMAPRTKADRERLGQGLQRLLAEAPTFRADTDPQTGQTIIRATGELHLQVIVERLKREFDVDAGVGEPQVACKEALTREADGETKYYKRPDERGRGQYAHVRIHVLPGEPATGYVFESRIGGHEIPKEYLAPIDDGIREAAARGVIAGHPIEDVKVELYDGSYHDVDSSEMAFRLAGAMAFQDAAKKAGPIRIEPVMHVEVVVPIEHAAAISGDLSRRRGRIRAQEERGAMQILLARVPLSEMLGYATDLRALTQGRATYAMQFDRYEPFGSDDPEESESMVATPQRPRQPSRHSAVALPEPDSTGEPEGP